MLHNLFAEETWCLLQLDGENLHISALESLKKHIFCISSYHPFESTTNKHHEIRAKWKTTKKILYKEVHDTLLPATRHIQSPPPSLSLHLSTPALPLPRAQQITDISIMDVLAGYLRSHLICHGLISTQDNQHLHLRVGKMSDSAHVGETVTELEWEEQQTQCKLE